jgi:hypothetical protein
MLRYSSRLYTTIIGLQLRPCGSCTRNKATFCHDNTAEKCVTLKKLKSKDQLLLTVSRNTFIICSIKSKKLLCTILLTYF